MEKQETYTLVIPLSRASKEKVILEIRELNDDDEFLWTTAQELIINGKMLEAIRMLLRSLTVEGDVEKIVGSADGKQKGSFYALRCCLKPIMDLIEVDTVELKKN